MKHMSKAIIRTCRKDVATICEFLGKIAGGRYRSLAHEFVLYFRSDASGGWSGTGKKASSPLLLPQDVFVDLVRYINLNKQNLKYTRVLSPKMNKY